MRKKLLVMFMAVCMTVFLVACGNSENSDKKENASETVVENEASEEKENLEASDTKVEEKDKMQEQSKSDDQQTVNQELTAEAEYANLTESTGFMFESNGDGTCTLVKLGDCTDSDIVIPEKSPAGDTITMIGEYAFYGAKDINSIVFAGSTMELDSNAFQACEAEKIVITGCDMVIGKNAFSYCEDVTEVYISGSALEVESYAFYDTGKDMKVKIVNCTGILDENAFQSSDIAELTINDSTLELDKNVFSYCEDLTAVTFDNSTVEIKTYAFYDSGDNATVTFTNCGLDIDDRAFQSCDLTTLNISGGETVMEDNAFSYCEDLTDVTIGVGNTEIGKYSFYDCTSLVNVSIAADSEDDSLELVIADTAFQSCSVQNVVIGRGNVKLGDNAFSYCKDLMSVDIKGVLSDIGDYVFYDCPAELVISYNGATYNKESIENVK
ncbi:MAG: leucine-rich repeat domain-containing protein [Coprococcus sp.]